jgi:hypothetical protein
VLTPSDFGLDYEDLRLENPDGVHISLYLLLQKKHVPQGFHVQTRPDETDEQVSPSTLSLFPRPDPFSKFASRRPTVIMFHGNGGNHGHRIPLAKVFYTRMRCNVLMPSYRG